MSKSATIPAIGLREHFWERFKLEALNQAEWETLVMAAGAAA